MAANMKMAVFWIVAPCSLVKVYGRFGCACFLHHQGDEGSTHRPDNGKERTSELSVNVYQTTGCNNPEESHLYTRRHENLKST
jgi:hypothetical protein